MESESTVAFIGLGLIGGSIARRIKLASPDTVIMAYMRTRSKLEQAKADGVIDVILDGIGEELSQCDMIFLCTPVEYNEQYLEAIRPYLKKNAIITDVGSTKTAIHEAVIKLDMESYFIGGHPMAGSEKTGYENSTDYLLENAYYVITPTAVSTEENIERLRRIALMTGAIPLRLDYRQHDYAVAAISHLPHIIASSLVNLVHGEDGDDGVMKQIAAGGFKDITRIASSSPVMWEQICMTNTENISSLLESYIQMLQQIQQNLKGRDSYAIHQMFEDSRLYRNSISSRGSGVIRKEYSFCVDVVDEPGAISTIAVILSAKGISIKNIGIKNNREDEPGVLKIIFYEETAMNQAWDLLKKHNYILYAR